jgi:hypothetical protein
MKKVAIVIAEMSIGGIPKACVDFANQLKDYCNVVLLMKQNDGSMMSGLSKEISVKLIKTPAFKSTIEKLKKRKKYLKIITYALEYIFLTKFSNRWVKANELTARTYGICEEDEYDCVITYHGMSISQLLTSLYGVKRLHGFMGIILSKEYIKRMSTLCIENLTKYFVFHHLSVYAF